MSSIQSSLPIYSATVSLKRGDLSVSANNYHYPPEDLFAFAERRNPKRAFLFVSRVLGKHIPVRPRTMRETYLSLASQIPKGLPGPILVMGLAETAVGLGAGVHQEFSRDREDVHYLISTRHPVGTGLFGRFEEEHSHASAHLIHKLANSSLTLADFKTVILVDDEASTGKTFANLYASLKEAGLTKIEQAVTVTLTDWSDNSALNAFDVPVTMVSLLSGSYSFNENPDAPLPAMPDVGAIDAGHWPFTYSEDWGRLGVTQHKSTLKAPDYIQPGDKVLVVGTGEYVWRPFLMAEQLEMMGVDVKFGSTTRSPIAVGHSIKCALTFSDNYGLGIPNFLYNVDPTEYDHILVCAETPAESLDRKLMNALGAVEVIDGE